MDEISETDLVPARSGSARSERAAAVAGERAVVSRSTLMTLRRVLHAYREGWLLDDRLARAAHMAADDARRYNLRAERMLVLLKDEWGALEEVRRTPMLEARALLGRLITAFIAAYYAPRRRRALPEALGYDVGACTAA